MKKYVEISVNKKTVVIAEVKECEPIEFIKKAKEAKNNFERLLFGYEERIARLEEAVRVLKGED